MWALLGSEAARLLKVGADEPLRAVDEFLDTMNACEDIFARATVAKGDWGRLFPLFLDPPLRLLALEGVSPRMTSFAAPLPPALAAASRSHASRMYSSAAEPGAKADV